MALVWVATAPIHFNNVLAFNPGNVVPDSVVTRFDLSTSGLVEHVEGSTASGPTYGVNPVTQAELNALTQGSGRLSDASLRAAFVPLDRGAIGKLDGGLAARSTSPCRVVFTGSSTTAGNNASDAAHRYVNLLTTALQTAYPSGLSSETTVVNSTSADFGTLSAAAGVHGYNAGEGGTTSATYLTGTEITKIGAVNPRAVVHMIGSNDFHDGVPVATFKANVQAAITALKAATAGPCVHVLVQSYERYDTFTPVAPWSDYGDALRQIADADPDTVVYFDISEPYYLLGIPGADPLNLLDTDNIHQTDAGHALMANLLRLRLAVPGGTSSSSGGGGGSPVSYFLPADTFNRANGQLDGTTTSVGGKTWATMQGDGAVAPATDVLIQSGAVGLRSSGATVVTSFSGIELGVPDFAVECTLTALAGTPSAQGGGLAGRISGTTDGIGIFLSTRINGSTAGWALYANAAAGATLLTSTTTPLPAAGDRLRLVLSGTTVTAFVNGAQILQATGVTTGQANTKAGFFWNPAGLATRFDDFARVA